MRGCLNITGCSSVSVMTKPTPRGYGRGRRSPSYRRPPRSPSSEFFLLHAAATNVHGGNVIRTAHESDVQVAVCLRTDKAVPVNAAMGLRKSGSSWSSTMGVARYPTMRPRAMCQDTPRDAASVCPIDQAAE